MVRTTHRLAARARLNDDGSGGFVCVTSALLTLGCAALRDGHGSGLRRMFEPLLGLPADIPQCVPTAISHWRTVTRASVQVSATRWTQPLAVLPTLNECRDSQQPLLAQGRAHVQLMRARINDVHVRIVGAFSICFYEQQLNVFADRYRHVGQTLSALCGYVTFERAAEVVATGSSSREPANHVYRCCRPCVLLLPNRVVRRQLAIDMNGLGSKRTNVKGQHSQPIYPPGEPLSSQRADVT